MNLIKHSCVDHFRILGPLQKTIVQKQLITMKQAYDDSEKKNVVLRIYKKVNIQRYNDMFEHEVSALQRLQHKNIARILSYSQHSAIYTKKKNGNQTQVKYIVLEELSEISLNQVIEIGKKLSEDHIRHFYSQLVEAVLHCHQLGIALTNIDPFNIFFDPKNMGTIKLVGLNLWHDLMPDNPVLGWQDSFRRTRLNPPELNKKNEVFNPATVDQFQLGVLLFQMCTGGELPFSNKAEERDAIYKFVMHKKFEDFWKFYEQERHYVFSLEFKLLVNQLITFNSSERLSVAEVKFSQWMVQSERPLSELEAQQIVEKKQIDIPQLFTNSKVKELPPNLQSLKKKSCIYQQISFQGIDPPPKNRSMNDQMSSITHSMSSPEQLHLMNQNLKDEHLDQNCCNALQQLGGKQLTTTRTKSQEDIHCLRELQMMKRNVFLNQEFVQFWCADSPECLFDFLIASSQFFFNYYKSSQSKFRFVLHHFDSSCEAMNFQMIVTIYKLEGNQQKNNMFGVTFERLSQYIEAEEAFKQKYQQLMEHIQKQLTRIK